MARKPRFQLPGIPQHVIQRGNNREPCFFSQQDYRFYLDALKDVAEPHNCHIHAYVLMTNHVHLLVTPHTENGISSLMQALGRRYVRYINHTYQRSGTLWEGRYKASLIDSERYLLTCMRYIELNPARANMVVHPADYRWSSYAHNAQGNVNPLVQSHPLYAALGRTAQQRQYAYRELFRAHLDPSMIHDIREALNQELVLGREDFKTKIETMTRRRTRAGKAGRPRIEEDEAVYVVY